MQDALKALVAAADIAGREIVSKGGLAIQASTLKHMDGRPGPKVVSGTLRRSVKVLSIERLSFGRWESRTAPTTVYGRRIELGFHGADSLGRIYNQPGYPYVQPGISDAQPVLVGIYRMAWSSALKL